MHSSTFSSKRGGRNPLKSLERRGRVSLAIGLAAFVLLQLAMSLVVARLQAQMHDPVFTMRAARLRARRATTSPAPVTILMLGSSRTGLGMKPARVEQPLTRLLGRPVIAFNFGVAGAGPTVELLQLTRMVREGFKADLLLVEVLPALLADLGGKPIETHWMRPDQLSNQELAVLTSFGLEVQDGNPRPRQSWTAPWWYWNRRLLLGLYGPRWWSRDNSFEWPPIDDWGTVIGAGWIAPENRPAAVERARAEYSSALAAFHLGAQSTRAFRELLDTCRRLGIRAALVLMPEGSVYRNWYPAPVWSEIRTFLDTTSRGFGVPIIDAREWMGDDQFSDSHHLLPDGAAAFTDLLVRDALEPLVTGAAH